MKNITDLLLGILSSDHTKFLSSNGLTFFLSGSPNLCISCPLKGGGVKLWKTKTSSIRVTINDLSQARHNSLEDKKQENQIRAFLGDARQTTRDLL